MADLIFNKVTSSHRSPETGFVFTVQDYIAVEHVNAYVVHQNSTGWGVLAVEPDDRPADADRSYNPPAYLLEGA